MKKQSIDISKHNLAAGPMDWGAVAAAGVDGVMIRAGWAGYAGELHLDPQLEECIQKASAAGLQVGLYVYAYCKNPTAARKAARETVAIARRHMGRITYPLALDVEETADRCLIAQGRKGLSNTVAAWCEEITELGWMASWYTYTSFAASHLDLTALAPYDLWVADYRGDREKMEAQLGRTEYGMWQYIGDRGRCPGVTGPCDRSHVYTDYPQFARDRGLNGLTKPTSLPWAQLAQELRERGIAEITL